MGPAGSVPTSSRSQPFTMKWTEFFQRSRPTLDPSSLGWILCLDPGETTGWSLWYHGELMDCGQVATPNPQEMAEAVKALYDTHLDLIVYEEYRIRGNKFKEHVGSEVVTIQNIGAIKVVAASLGVPTFQQSAAIAKGFATDAKLRMWGLYQKGQRHANDSIRHGARWHLFVSGRSREGLER